MSAFCALDRKMGKKLQAALLKVAEAQADLRVTVQNLSERLERLENAKEAVSLFASLLFLSMNYFLTVWSCP